MLRSCYSTDWNFYSDTKTPIRVRWYFCPDGAEILPFDSVFTSNNWDADSEQNHHCGEIVGAPRQWKNGATPPTALGVHSCGQADQFANGFPLGTFHDVPYDAWNIPLCCGAPLPFDGALGVQLGLIGEGNGATGALGVQFGMGQLSVTFNGALGVQLGLIGEVLERGALGVQLGLIGEGNGAAGALGVQLGLIGEGNGAAGALGVQLGLIGEVPGIVTTCTGAYEMPETLYLNIPDLCGGTVNLPLTFVPDSYAGNDAWISGDVDCGDHTISLYFFCIGGLLFQLVGICNGNLGEGSSSSFSTAPFTANGIGAWTGPCWASLDAAWIVSEIPV